MGLAEVVCLSIASIKERVCGAMLFSFGLGSYRYFEFEQNVGSCDN